MPVQTRSMTKKEQLKEQLREECLHKKAEMDVEWEAKPQRKKRTAIQAKYTLYSVFVPPEGVKLMTETELITARHGPDGRPIEPGYWWIKWDVLHYIGEDGNIHEIDPFFEDEGDARKRPEQTEEIEWTM